MKKGKKMSDNITFCDIQKIGMHKGSIMEITIFYGKYDNEISVILTDAEYNQLPAELRSLLEFAAIIAINDRMIY